LAGVDFVDSLQSKAREGCQRVHQREEEVVDERGRGGVHQRRRIRPWKLAETADFGEEFLRVHGVSGGEEKRDEGGNPRL
jgi:hypothetical protein